MNGEYRLDFQWPRASKYELRPATTEEVERCRAEPLSNDPRPMDMAERALFPNVPEADLPMYFGHIVPIGRAAYHRPRAEAMDYAVRALVECKETPLHRVALTAARALGTLNDLYGDRLPDEDDEHVRSTRILEEAAGISLPDARSDRVCDWYWMAHHLRLIFRGKWFDDNCEEFNWPDDPETYTVGELAVLLVPDKNNKPVLAVRPDCLIDALVFTAARMKATGTTFDICEHCRSPFLSGGIRYRAKRGDAKFCSDPCRYSYHNEQRRRAKGELHGKRSQTNVG